MNISFELDDTTTNVDLQSIKKDDSLLIEFLDEYKNSILANTISIEKRMNLIEAFIKDKILEDSTYEEEDIFKYAFLGAYVYKFLVATTEK
jgi:hypothetical protein